jgi:expansin (peptidoglycan-binding protein)
MEGAYLAGLDNSFNGDGSLCDACVLMTSAKGKSIVLRVVTTGVSQAPTNADLSKAAYDALSMGVYPRTMTWQLVECPDTGKLQYQFQTGAYVYWTSLWVRNGRVPITKVEVQSKNHPSFVALTRGTDGTLTDASGFGDGMFTLRITGMDGQMVTDTFPSFQPGQLVASQQQLQ